MSAANRNGVRRLEAAVAKALDAEPPQPKKKRRKADQRSAFGSARKQKRSKQKPPPACPPWLDPAEYEQLVALRQRIATEDA